MIPEGEPKTKNLVTINRVKRSFDWCSLASLPSFPLNLALIYNGPSEHSLSLSIDGCATRSYVATIAPLSRRFVFWRRPAIHFVCYVRLCCVFPFAISGQKRKMHSKNILTLEMMIPAMLIRMRGPFSNRYLKSTPFQNDTKYRLIYSIRATKKIKRNSSMFKEDPSSIFCVCDLPEYYRLRATDNRRSRRWQEFLDKW